MKKRIRQCISCILPCGALDVIRIIHSNGRVEEITGGTNIKASDIIKAHPKHVLKKPAAPNSPSDGGVHGGIVIVPPEAELQRGKIYFLIPLPPSPEKNNHRKKKKKKLKQHRRNNNICMNNNNNNDFLVSDRYLTEILSEKVSSRHTTRGRVAVWRPNLESISESPSHDF